MLVLKHLGRCRHETCYRTIESVLISINKKISRTTANEIRSRLAKREINYIHHFFWVVTHLLSKCVLFVRKNNEHLLNLWNRTQILLCQSKGSKKHHAVLNSWNLHMYVYTYIYISYIYIYIINIYMFQFPCLPKWRWKIVYKYIYIYTYKDYVYIIIYIYLPFPDLLFRSGNP